ncbi:MAG: hypothetical protein V3T30_02765, partial [Thermodesulfobacteriota bacterium]
MKKTTMITAIMLGLFLLSKSAVGAPEVTMAKSALKFVEVDYCSAKVIKNPGINNQERWVWNQLCKGEVADLNKKYGKLDPKKPEGWTEGRVIRAAFIEKLATKEPYKTALARKGVRISGAWITKEFDLSYATLDSPLSLTYSKIDQKVKFIRLKSSSYISLSGSLLSGQLVMTK